MVEASIEHSKTGPRRTVTAVGLSRGEAKVPLADLVRSYWRAAGFVIRRRTAGGFAEEAADYKVVRVSLMALGVDACRDGERLRRLVAALEVAESEEVRRWASVVALRGGQRMKGDSADKKYVNVVGGCAECQAIGEALRILKREGFDEQGRVAVVPGPFMRATHGNLGLSHLPMQPTNAPVRDILAEAFERVQARGPDPEFDLEGRDSPQWGNHSIRRGLILRPGSLWQRPAPQRRTSTSSSAGMRRCMRRRCNTIMPVDEILCGERPHVEAMIRGSKPASRGGVPGVDGMSDGGRSGAESWDMPSTIEKAPKQLGLLSNP